MRFKEVEYAIRGGGRAAREAWNGKAYLSLPIAGCPDMYLCIDDQCFQYSFSFEDATADDWLNIPIPLPK